MPQERHGPEETAAKLRQVAKLVLQVQSVAEAVRLIGVTQSTYYRWRKKFGGQKSDQVKRLMELEKDRAMCPPLIVWMAPPTASRCGKVGPRSTHLRGAIHGQAHRHRPRSG